MMTFFYRSFFGVGISESRSAHGGGCRRDDVVILLVGVLFYLFIRRGFRSSSYRHCALWPGILTRKRTDCRITCPAVDLRHLATKVLKH